MKRNKNRKFKTKNRRVVRNQKIRERRFFRSRNKTKCRKGFKSPNQLKKPMLYTFHWLIGESKKTPLSNFINSINEKINDLSDLLEETYATMQKEYEEKVAKIREPYEAYEAYEAELEQEYQKLFKKYLEDGVDEPLASQMASHESGQADFENHQQHDEHELYDRNYTLSELFFKSMLITLYSIVESEVIHTIVSEKLPVKFCYSKNLREIDFIKQILENNNIIELRPLDYVRNLRVIRNSIVHNKSILKPDKKDDHKILVPILKEDKNCTLNKVGDNYGLSINNIQFIRNHILSIQVLFNQVQWAIDKEDEYELLKSRLIFLLKISDKEVTIESINVNYQLKETLVVFEGHLPTQGNLKYKGTLSISNNLDQDSKSMISFTNSIFDSLKSSDAIDFLYNTALKGFLCKELNQKANLKFSIVC